MSTPKARSAARVALEKMSTVSIPVDVRKLAKQEGIMLMGSARNEADISGALVRGKEYTMIVVNLNHSETRQRFTIAHELGHYFLHHDPVFVDRETHLVNFRRKQKGYNHAEAEANTFAAELLMPSQQLKADVEALHRLISPNRKHLTASSLQLLIDSLAEKYCVSRDAMKYQLANLSLVTVK